MSQYSFSDILGPIMIGPSSSHTAGAAKLGLVAKYINHKTFSKVEFLLHGSFASTYKGHGTDKALIGGILGFEPYDVRLRDAYEHAKARNIEVSFMETELEGMHENSVGMIFYNDNGSINKIYGSSLGGGEIVIKRINDFVVSFKGDLPTVIIRHQDKKGVLSVLTTIFATRNINIATMEVSRTSKNKEASIIIELDDPLNEGVLELIENIPHVESVKYIEVDKGVGDV
ncbi:L-serine ammonia-lyase, iron-sulfur-dependent, subunit beta [Acidaminobacter sp. JC074]|uniref:L-serine ammonia-lyase, iron-sulfur-dependent subunit beta n=1 Tax=Acidaminobacter sp. JC074 TaxID=2530199 RepID=UPI001F0E0DC6|nr:L-serine ammonia-lyase, iron-sulfur-dependent subunit beta [Acidaminobacter sp. JC074]MCH4888151.1 L-serine ammonia-lyase, iron-sulfur-dependent, subunit beta [Acidaminobacter sp. JC074]